MKVRRRVRKPANSSAKKWSTFARASTAHVQPSRRSQSVCQRPAAPVSSCRRQKRVPCRSRRAGALSSRRKPESEATRASRRPVPAPSPACSSAKDMPPPRNRRWRSSSFRGEPPHGHRAVRSGKEGRTHEGAGRALGRRTQGGPDARAQPNGRLTLRPPLGAPLCRIAKAGATKIPLESRRFKRHVATG